LRLLKAIAGTFFVLAMAQGASAQNSAVDTASSWWNAAQHAWHEAVKEGRPAAERFARQWPKRFGQIRAETYGVIKKAKAELNDSDLDAKKNLLIELIRIHRSLDLAALLSPEVLHQLTGLDPHTVAQLESRVASFETIVRKQVSTIEAKLNR
jgi:hypothetical protein